MSKGFFIPYILSGEKKKGTFLDVRSRSRRAHNRTRQP